MQHSSFFMNATRFVKKIVSRVRGHPYLFLRTFYVQSRTQPQPQPHPLDDDANHDRRRLTMDAMASMQAHRLKLCIRAVAHALFAT